MRPQNMRRIHIPEADLRHWYLDLEQTASDIANHVGCSSPIVKMRLQEYGIPVRTLKESMNTTKHVSKLSARMTGHTYNVGRYKFHIGEEYLYHHYIELQQSAPDIAKQIGCSKPTILQKLKEYGIPARSGKGAHNIKPYIAKFEKEILASELQEKYIAEQLGTREIGKLYNCSANCVRSNLRRCGIPIRTKKEAQATPSCVVGREKVATHQRKPEIREYRRRLMQERYSDPVEREKIGFIMQQYHKNNPDFSKHQIAILQAIRSDPVIRQKHKTNSRCSWTAERRLAQSAAAKRNWNDPVFRSKQIARMKKNWRANNFAAMKKMMLANCISPNKPETSVLSILNELYPNEWKFTGDGQVIMDGLNPDFINTNGKKLIIEVFGDYWHRQNVKPYRINEGRVDVYAQFGYKTLIIWESETKNTELLRQKIQEFVG